MRLTAGRRLDESPSIKTLKQLTRVSTIFIRLVVALTRTKHLVSSPYEAFPPSAAQCCRSWVTYCEGSKTRGDSSSGIDDVTASSAVPVDWSVSVFPDFPDCSGAAIDSPGGFVVSFVGDGVKASVTGSSFSMLSKASSAIPAFGGPPPSGAPLATSRSYSAWSFRASSSSVSFSESSPGASACEGAGPGASVCLCLEKKYSRPFGWAVAVLLPLFSFRFLAGLDILQRRQSKGR